MPLRINLAFIITKLVNNFSVEILKLGNANAMFTGNNAIQRKRQLHDFIDNFLSLLQHRIVAGMHRNIRMYIAIPCVHMQRDEQSA